MQKIMLWYMHCLCLSRYCFSRCCLRSFSLLVLLLVNPCRHNDCGASAGSFSSLTLVNHTCRSYGGGIPTPTYRTSSWGSRCASDTRMQVFVSAIYGPSQLRTQKLNTRVSRPSLHLDWLQCVSRVGVTCTGPVRTCCPRLPDVSTHRHVQDFQEVPNIFDMLLPTFLMPVEGKKQCICNLCARR